MRQKIFNSYLIEIASNYEECSQNVRGFDYVTCIWLQAANSAIFADAPPLHVGA